MSSLPGKDFYVGEGGVLLLWYNRRSFSREKGSCASRGSSQTIPGNYRPTQAASMRGSRHSKIAGGVPKQCRRKWDMLRTFILSPSFGGTHRCHLFREEGLF